MSKIRYVSAWCPLQAVGGERKNGSLVIRPYDGEKKKRGREEEKEKTRKRRRKEKEDQESQEINASQGDVVLLLF